MKVRTLLSLVLFCCVGYGYVQAQRLHIHSTDLQLRDEKIVSLPDTALVSQTTKISPAQTYRCSFTLQADNHLENDYLLFAGRWGEVTCQLTDEDGTITEYSTGTLLPMAARNYASYQSVIKLPLKRNHTYQVLVTLRGKISILTPNQISLTVVKRADFQAQNNFRLLSQGVFLGIILVMALYNLLIFLAVKDISYLYYVFSIVGVGIYFAFYYGFGIEYLWTAHPYWDAHSFTFVIPLTGIARLYFTKSYLHTSLQLPTYNKAINFLISAYLLLLLVAMYNYIFTADYLVLLTNLIGAVGVVVFILMFLAGLAGFLRGFPPAKYFMIANAIFVVGAISFTLMEVGLLADTWFARNGAQLGVITQVVLFSLGLSSRLNRTRAELALKTLEKERVELEREREKKEIIEEQKRLLQQKVEEQTADLKLKTAELESTVRQLRKSEVKLKDLNKIKDKLLSVISHDLKNPLVSFHAFITLMTKHENQLTPEEKELYANKTQQTLQQMLQMLENLLQWSKVQMKMTRFEPEPVPLAETWEEVTQLLELSINFKQLQIVSHIPEGTTVMADKEMLGSVLRNLLSNAIKFSHHQARITLCCLIETNQTVIQVKDEGVGMSDTQINALKNSENLTVSKGTAKEKGTGLGLLICQDFLAKHHSELTIARNQPQGMIFSFALPLQLQPSTHRPAGNVC